MPPSSSGGVAVLQVERLDAGLRHIDRVAGALQSGADEAERIGTIVYQQDALCRGHSASDGASPRGADGARTAKDRRPSAG